MVTGVTTMSNNTHQLSLGSQQWNVYHTALLDPVESTHPAGNDEDTYTLQWIPIKPKQHKQQ